MTLPTYRSLQFLKHTTLLSISMPSHEHFLLLENVSLFFTRLILLIVQVLVSITSPDDTPHSRRFWYFLFGSPLCLLAHELSLSFQSQQSAMCIFASRWTSVTIWRARSVCWFLFLSTLEWNPNQCQVEEELKCSSSLSSRWTQLWSWNTVPSELSCRVKPKLSSESLLDIAFLCALPFLCLSYSHFPTIFLW